jgi:hypothetical protein
MSDWRLPFFQLVANRAYADIANNEQESVKVRRAAAPLAKSDTLAVSVVGSSLSPGPPSAHPKLEVELE